MDRVNTCLGSGLRSATSITGYSVLNITVHPELNTGIMVYSVLNPGIMVYSVLNPGTFIINEP